MDYLSLLASIGLAMAVLGLNLLIQSLILLRPLDRLPLLGRILKRLSYAILIPLGVILVAVGTWILGLNIQFVSVGVMLVLLAVALLVQSEALITVKDSLIQLGWKIRIWAYVYAIGGFIIVVIVTILMFSFLD